MAHAFDRFGKLSDLGFFAMKEAVSSKSGLTGMPNRGALTVALACAMTCAPFAAGATCTLDQKEGITRGVGGGGGSTDWNDASFAAQGGPITAVTVWSGTYVDAIRVRYGSLWGYKHGGGGGSPATIELAAGEKITTVSGRFGDAVDQLCFTTTLQAERCYGGGGGQASEFNYPGLLLGYLSGRAGDILDHLVFHFQPSSRIDVSTAKYNNFTLAQEILAAPDRSFSHVVRNDSPLEQQVTATFTAADGFSHMTSWHAEAQNQWLVGIELGGSIGEEKVAQVKASLKFEYTRTESSGKGGEDRRDHSESHALEVPVRVPPNSAMEVIIAARNVQLNLAVTYDRVYFSDLNLTREICRESETSNINGPVSVTTSTNFKPITGGNPVS